LAPWRTLQRALNAVLPGQTVYVRAGTYPEWATLSRSGTAVAPITLRAYPGEQPVLTGRLKLTGSYARVSGFLFQGGTASNATGVLVYVSGGDDLELSANEIRGAAMSGVYVGDPGNRADHLFIVGNFIHDNGTHTNLDHGIYFGYGSAGLIANNLIVHNFAQGIKLAPDAQATIATANTVVGNGRSGILVGGDTVDLSNNNMVVNNIAAYNSDWGIRSYWEQAVGSGNLALRNLVFANRAGHFWFPGGGMVERRSIRSDPRFVSPVNYRLRAGSPAINRAIAAFSMPFDFDGRGRPLGAGPDIGAYER